MDENEVVKTFIRLINERPTGVWYMRKSHYPDTDWDSVAGHLSQQGYTVEDSGDVVRGSKCLE